MEITRDEAWKLLNEYNREPFHLKHAQTVEGVMRYFADELGYGDERISGALWDFCTTLTLKNIPICTA